MSREAHAEDDTPDEDETAGWTGFTRRQRYALLVAGLALFYAIAPLGLVLAEDFIAGSTVHAGQGGHIGAVNGPTVELGRNYELQSGNPATAHSVNVSTATDGWVNLSAPSSGAEVRVDAINGTWTRFAELNVSSVALTANVSDKQRVRLAGDLETFNYTQMAIGDGNVDFEYTGTGGTASVTIYGLQDDVVVRAVDPAGNTLDSARSNAQGTVTLDSLPLSSHQVSLVGSVADYYANESANVDQDAWFAGVRNASMDDIISMGMRLGPYVIGSGQPTAGGAGYTGVLLLGLIVAGIFLAAVAGTPVGTTGSSVVALVVGYGLVEVGLAPPWMRVVLLFLLGVVAAVVAIRAAR